ncbi:zinc finger, CCHC-type containing protein [Tanacetum coccineum]|uniref:Zinc finger, CCHC-type containing protein n=1 Tax=Tanacetum coccineum TaxID=301880 RepID=A0ABQ4ZE31_9ASTR
MVGSYYSFPCSILYTKKDCKTPHDILMFQQHQGESLSEAWTLFKDLLQKVPHHGIDRWLQIQKFYDHVSFHLKYEIDRAVDGKSLRTSPFMTMKARMTQENSSNCRAPKKVLIKEEAKSIVTKNLNSISLARREEERNDNDDMAADGGINGMDTEITVKEAENETKNKPIKRAEREENGKASRSQPVGYYLKHRINEKLIEGLVDNHRFNDSLLGIQVGKVKGKTYNLLPRGPVYEAILRKKITRKEDIRGNFEIPCNIGGLKCMNALVDQGSDVNGMPLSTNMKLTDERPVETNIRLSLASHSYIYPLGIAKDVLVDVVGYVYPVDFLILDIKEDEKRPFILGTPFLMTAKAVIKFDKGTASLRMGGKDKTSPGKGDEIQPMEEQKLLQ